MPRVAALLCLPLASSAGIAIPILAVRSRGSEIPLLAKEIYRKGSLRVPGWSRRSTEMDHPWTTSIESRLLNREKVAEGKGSVSFHDTEANSVVWQARASPRLAGFESHPASASIRARIVPCEGSYCSQRSWTLMAEGVGFEPTDRVNGRRFSRPLQAFQARQNQTKQDQKRLIAADFLGKAPFVWFCPD